MGDSSASSNYQELSQTQAKDLDPSISRILPDITLKGGDITRNLLDHNHPKMRTRSSSFSTFLQESRRESTASDINIPGGFRRQFIINQSIKQKKAPPKFLTNNLIEFLNVYSNFAGEDFNDEEDESVYGYGYGDLENGIDDDTVDEETLLLSNENNQNNSNNNNNDGSSKGTKKSNLKTYFLLFKALVGSGILFLPKAFSNGGLLFSILTLNLFGFLTFICYLLLIYLKNHFKLSSFGELGFKTYGNPLKILILISILISQIGFVSTYILFATKNLSNLINLTDFKLVMIQFLLLIPLMLIRKISKLSFVSLISSACIIIGLIIIFYYSIKDLVQSGVGPGIIQFNSNSWSMLIGVAVTSFEGIGLILPIESSMGNPKEFTKVLAISMIGITSLFSLTGIIGYLTFGETVQTIILLNLPYKNVSVQLILVLYSLAVFLTAPLQLFPAIKILEGLVFNSSMFFKNGKLYNSGKFNNKIKWLKNIFRMLFIGAVCILAYFNFDHIDKFVAFNGCFACIPLVYIYPPLIHYKSLSTSSFKLNCLKTFDLSLAFTGIILVIYSTYQILFLN